MLCIASTFYELKIQNSSLVPKKLFTTFSLCKNGQNLLDTTTSKNSYNSLFGIRSIAALGIMFCHRYSIDFIAFDRVYTGTPLHYAIRWARMAVDTFFVISAFLQTISMLKAIDDKRLNVFKVIIKRYLRYTPAVLGSVFMDVLLPHFVNGPLIDDNLFSRRERYTKIWWRFITHRTSYFRPVQW
jgi:peptidoglycan/LPS O-acetylase OafA/YrhL